MTVAGGGGGGENKVVRGKQHKPLPPTPSMRNTSSLSLDPSTSSIRSSSAAEGGVPLSTTSVSSSREMGPNTPQGSNSSSSNSGRIYANANDFGIPGSSAAATAAAASVGGAAMSPAVSAIVSEAGNGTGSPGTPKDKKQSAKSSIFSRLLGQN